MRKKLVLLVSAVLSLCVLCVCLAVSPKNTTFKISDNGVTVHNAPVATAPVNEVTEAQAVEVSEIEEEKVLSPDDFGTRFVKMLNINYCYGESFGDMQKVVDASAITLRDYSADVLGYGLCVNDILVEGFAESFYGVNVEFDSRARRLSPEGYIAIPEVELATQYHELVSFTENEGVFEVITNVTFYYGGDDVETSVAVSHFVRNCDSEFGFNLLSCNIF